MSDTMGQQIQREWIYALGEQISSYFDTYSDSNHFGDKLIGIAIGPRNAGDLDQGASVYFYGYGLSGLPSTLAFRVNDDNIELPVRARVSKHIVIVWILQLLVFLALMWKIAYDRIILKKPNPYCDPAAVRFQGGDCIACKGGGPGTLGGVIVSPTGERYFITNAHVVYGNESVLTQKVCSLPLGNDIFSYAVPDQRLGKVSIISRQDAQGYVASDSALVLNDEGNVDSAIGGEYAPTVTQTALYYEKVMKVGMASGRIRNKLVHSVAGTWRRDGRKRTHMMRIENLAGQGDSGSLVLNEDGTAIVGLITYNDLVRFTFAHQIEAVEIDLGAQNWYWNG